MPQGSFEPEIEVWMHSIKTWVSSHERFTWMTLLLSISPSPFAAILGLTLASVQFALCSQGRIPPSERRLLTASLLLSSCNLVWMIFALWFLTKHGWTLWQILHPLWWLRVWFGLDSSGQTSVWEVFMDQVPTIPRQADQKFCRACAAIVHMSAEFCTKCGAKQVISYSDSNTGQGSKAADQKYCSACGFICHISAANCPKCGAMLSSGGIGEEKNKTVAVLLALLLGGFGAHKFYLGRPLMGILYIVFCWTLIPALVALIEGIWYATLSDATFQQRSRAGTLWNSGDDRSRHSWLTEQRIEADEKRIYSIARLIVLHYSSSCGVDNHWTLA